MYVKTNINNLQCTGWFKLNILFNFISENILFRCTIPLIKQKYILCSLYGFAYITAFLLNNSVKCVIKI